MDFAVIFDMDGVLIDSIKPIWKSYEVLLKEKNVEFSKDYIKNNVARSLRDNLKAWESEFGLEDYDLLDFSKKAGNIELELIKDIKANEDLLVFLESLKSNGIKCAVATSSLRWRAEKILDQLGIKDFFETIVTAEDVENHKPSPDIFLEASNRLGVDPLNCVVLEDAKKGIDGTINAKMKSIGVLNDYNDPDDLKHADLVIDSFSNINIDRVKELF